MKLATYLMAFCVCAFSATYADEPKSPAAPSPTLQAETLATPAPAATPATAAATPATAAATAPAATEPKADTSEIVNKAATEAQIKTMRARGYKPVNRNGILVYCRAEGQLGTHFEKQRCNTLDELKNAELTGSEYVKSIQQQGSPTPFLRDGPGR